MNKDGWLFIQNMQKTFGMEAFHAIHEIERKTYSAYIAERKITAIKKRMAGNINDMLKWYETRQRFELETYEYIFFCSVRRIYDELRLLTENTNFERKETQEYMASIKHLKDQRDGLEHGSEDYWDVLKDRLKKPNVQMGQLLRKQRKGDNFDFVANMKLLDEIYAFVCSKILVKN